MHSYFPPPRSILVLPLLAVLFGTTAAVPPPNNSANTIPSTTTPSPISSNSTTTSNDTIDRSISSNGSSNSSTNSTASINLPAFPYARLMASSVLVRGSMLWIVGGALTTDMSEPADPTLRAILPSLSTSVTALNFLPSNTDSDTTRLATGETALPPNPMLTAAGLTCHYHLSSDTVICIGGIARNQPPQTPQPLTALDLTSLSFDDAFTNLPPRYHHASTLVDDTIYVFGGLSASTENPLNDLHMIPLSAPSASHALGFTSLFGPKPAARHNTCLTSPTPTTLLLFAGSTTTAGPTNDIWLYDITADKYTDATPWFAARRPTPRKGHTCVADPRGNVYVFGGETATGTFLNDLWVLDTHKWTWTQRPNPSAFTIPPRAYHQSVLIGPYLVVTGGATTTVAVTNTTVQQIPTDRTVYLYDTESGTWITDTRQLDPLLLRLAATAQTPAPPAGSPVLKYALIATAAFIGVAGLLLLAAFVYSFTQRQHQRKDHRQHAHNHHPHNNDPPKRHSIPVSNHHDLLPLPSKQHTLPSPSHPPPPPSPPQSPPKRTSAVFPVIRLSTLSPFHPTHINDSQDSLRLSASSEDDLLHLPPVPPLRSSSTTRSTVKPANPVSELK
ncbi:hypothetical protein DFJ77DRAFT_552269 [Powellomyces hirtus]|nr:hypothetical protein DFJ77DRAFT_552269 [Powellomyces hirtus]